MTVNILGPLAFLILSPIAGGLLMGLDRKLSARLQGRVGPPLLQPFYDVFKLFQKQGTAVSKYQNFYVICFFVFMLFSGILLFSGGNILLALFALTVADIFYVMGGYSSHSPFSFLGSERELLQMMAYEPMLLLTAIGFYKVGNSFFVADIIRHSHPAVTMIPLMFLGYVFVLTIKLRKSPFDLSTSHHAHQELVKGITTEFSGKTLGLVEVAHWYETIFALALVYLFFVYNSPLGIILGTVACIVIYVAEIFIDNSFARGKWQAMLFSSWMITAVLSAMNLIILFFNKTEVK